MRTSNPALNDAVFRIHDDSATSRMTLQGTVVKTSLLLAILIVGAGFTWIETMSGMRDVAVAEAVPSLNQLANVPSVVYRYLMIGSLGGLALAMITIFKPAWSPYTAPVYALLEGIFLGALSATFEFMYPGVVPEAVALTFGTLAALLTAYATRLIRASENFKLGIFAATGGICLFYLANMVLSLFGVQIPLIHESGPVGILFSLFVVTIAALNLVLDFDFIENGCAQGAPKYMEWYAGFGLLVTLVWLYLEILRLLIKLRNRD